MDDEAVRDYVEESQSTIEAAPQMDEANTKAAVLQGFLRLLDWEIPANTQLEYSVRAFGRTYKVDYALVLEGAPVAFLEAKGLDTALTEEHEEQLSSYMANENVNYGILANGEEYRFFQRRVNASNVSVQKIAAVPLQELPDRLAVLKAYTKDAISSGESGKILGRINELREARATLESEKDSLASEVATTLSERVSDTISSLAESQSKEMIDRLVADIDSEIDADGRSTETRRDDIDPELNKERNRVSEAIRRAEIKGDEDAKVAVFPTQKSGLSFLKENNAWGFVRVGSDFDYVAMYVTGDVREVKYFAKVKDVVSPGEAELARPADSYADSAKIAEGKKVIRFEPGSLRELEDPVPFETKYPQALRYTTLGELRSAETTDDML